MANVIIPQRFWMRRGTAAALATANEVLNAGEVCVVTDSGNPLAFKIGDGTTAWNSLPVQSAMFAAASGTNTLSATFKPLPVLFDGMVLQVRAAGANTGAVTFNPNSLGALAITKLGGTALAAGDIAGAGHELLLRYRASPARYELLNPAAGGFVNPMTAAGDIIIGGTSGAPTRLAAATNGYVLTLVAGVPAWAPAGAGSNGGTIGCTFDGGGSALIAGTVCDVVIPANCTINAATLLGDQTGSLVVSVWSDIYGNYPPTAADNIAASAPPTISAALKSRDTTLTGWTTALVAGRTLRFRITSCTAITRATLTLEVTKT